MIVSVTELNLKNLWSFFRFIPFAIKSKIQAEKSPGILSLSLGRKGLFTQRTLTVWKDEQSLKNYAYSGAHLQAMKLFSKIAKTSYTVRFEANKVPSWEEAIRYLRENGKAHKAK